MSDVDISFDDLASLLDMVNDGSGGKVDVMQMEMEKEISRIQKRLEKEYKQAEKELKKKADDYFAKFAERDKMYRGMVDDGLMSLDDYIKWRENRILYGENLKNQVAAMSEHLANVNQQAMDVANGRLPSVYAQNYNYGRYQVEKGFGINTSFTLFDEKTVERLAKKNPKLLPTRKLDKTKDKKWSTRKINNVITQGVLQGKPLKKIAEDLSSVVGMEKRAAMRNARTAMTGAQNAGRLDSFADSKRMGIKLKKQWMATLDERTRSSHQELDGESVDIDKKFSNKLEYPADPEGKPAEVYNCRCTMVADLIDFPDGKFQRYDNIEGKPIENVTYKEWAKAKAPKTPSAEPAHTANMADYEQVKRYAENSGIEHRNVDVADKEMTTDEIIEMLGGGDMTSGSCASLAFAFCGNHHGLKVIDFRGGASQSMFSRDMNITKMFKVSNAEVIHHEVEREAKDVAKILGSLENDKMFYLVTGRHAAIVRNDPIHGLQYLELQSPFRNGFQPFETGERSAEETLRRRFGCRKTIDRINIGGTKITRKRPVYLVDIDSMEMTPEFKDMLGYINTAPDKQRKGVRGARR